MRSLLNFARYSDLAFTPKRSWLSFPRAFLARARNPGSGAAAGKKIGIVRRAATRENDRASIRQQLHCHYIRQSSIATHFADRLSYSTRAFLALFAIASLLYTFHLGTWSLGASEAYSARAASQGTLTEVIQQALRFDPGKPPMYQVLLHCFVGIFGSHETSLRGLSVIFALVALLPLYSLGLSMFGSDIALAAAAIWAINPIALLLAQWARMYTLFIAAVLINMLAFWRLREQPNKRRIAAYAVSTALVLYTHLCGLLFVGIEAAVLIRDLYHGRRTGSAWVGMAIALMLFVPFLPQEVVQTRALLFGHWLDRMGIGQFDWNLRKSVIVVFAGAVMSAVVFGSQLESDDREPIRFCVLWLTSPMLALGVISVIMRPAIAMRYIAPAVPAGALLIARGLEVFGAKVRNLSAAGITMAFAVLFFFCKAARCEPWANIARRVASGGAAQAVFFESPLDVNGTQRRIEVDEQSDMDFPQGYFRVPFDYYFKGTNPRRVINPFDPAHARHAISSAALRAGGAWLVSGSSDLVARAEMPQLVRFRIIRVLHTDDTSLYHVIALPPQEFRNHRAAYSASSQTWLGAR
jgi:hypothetical protein